MSATVEAYAIRPIHDLGVWTIGPVRLKIYGLTAAGADVTETMLDQARAFVEADVQEAIKAMGDSNDLGFVIVHPGTGGVTISAFWWAQGSVLCQNMRRQLYDAAHPVADRPVIGCVWELELIDAERQAWTQHMMGAKVDPDAYLKQRPPSA